MGARHGGRGQGGQGSATWELFQARQGDTGNNSTAWSGCWREDFPEEVTSKHQQVSQLEEAGPGKEARGMCPGERAFGSASDI